MNAIDIQKIVDRIGGECFEAHRGAFWWHEDRRIAIAFGNDGYAQDERARLEVRALRELLPGLGGRELAFATESEGGYGWALACEIPEELGPENLEAALWSVWE